MLQCPVQRYDRWGKTTHLLHKCNNEKFIREVKVCSYLLELMHTPLDVRRNVFIYCKCYLYLGFSFKWMYNVFVVTKKIFLWNIILNHKYKVNHVLYATQYTYIYIVFKLRIIIIYKLWSCFKFFCYVPLLYILNSALGLTGKEC